MNKWLYRLKQAHKPCNTLFRQKILPETLMMSYVRICVVVSIIKNSKIIVIITLLEKYSIEKNSRYKIGFIFWKKSISNHGEGR